MRFYSMIDGEFDKSLITGDVINYRYKPKNNGILWCSPLDPKHNVPKWLTWDPYWTEYREINCVEFDVDLSSKDILVIDNNEILYNLIDKESETIDFRSLSKIYKGVYVDYEKIMWESSNFDILDTIGVYDCNTLMVFNSDIMNNIEYNNANTVKNINKYWDYL